VRGWLTATLGCLALTCTTAAAADSDLPLGDIRLPPGFHIAVYATGVENAREMARGQKGTIFVGSREAGKVHAIVDRDGDGRADQVLLLAEDLNMPTGVAFRGGALYVAEVNRILRFDDVESRLTKPPEPKVVSADFPDESHHGWKFIAFGPDGLLYVPVGAPCNVCDTEGFASIHRMKPDGSGHEVFARGIRNTVGFDWSPDAHELWFTENGRDNMGDDVPPDELDRAPRAGLHFGFPFCHGKSIADPKFGLERKCSEFVPPARELGPHVAALGMRFYTGKMFPEAYRGQIFIAEHGSWNRTQPIGYRVMLVRRKGGEAVSYEPFAEGWMQKGRAWGRPSDVLVMPDGALLVADDEADAIYRITYSTASAPND
jgi:glucose/arabinose dehydrogenase